MKPFSLQDVIAATGGTYKGEADPAGIIITGVCTDSRRAASGDLFIPIRGERFDGHDFIASALESGATACLSEKALEAGAPCVLVEDTLAAFQAQAAFYKDLFAVKTVGITGSVGKTTTKEFVAAVLSQKFNVLKSIGNLNNQVGVPMTVLRLEQEHEMAVIEMGTNHFGEIAAVAKIVRPDICLFTNIGDSHIEHLGSREGILKAKAEMLPFMRPGGRVIINGDDSLLLTLKDARDDVICVGLGPENDIRATDLVPKGLLGTGFTVHYEGREALMRVNRPGTHMVMNALAAFACGRIMDMDVRTIQEGLDSYEPVGGRMNIVQAGGLTILNDVYNANPNSMRAAIDVLKQAQGRKVCILGDMFELGENAADYHRQIGKYAASAGIDEMIFVGQLAQYMVQGAQQQGRDARYFSTQQALIDHIFEYLRDGDNVLVKASHGMHLEDTVEHLQNR
ncbi:MAG: UDP-N-acetylmuramoyl-tripeptide--D-alanyl-D-alanine ligase [Christensenellales bacterium]|jgi:UDP-N-acetylmuramoyl-tripeptide--D-alanyl-D-alanine ligase